MRRKRTAIEQLRLAIDCLPVDTRVAMLRGIRENEIIVGAYTDSRGGVCPMLAAHRCGGRTDFITFARSWDRFTRVGNRARAASERELRILVSHLEASLLAEDGTQTDLQRAITDHEALRARSAAERPVPARAEHEPRRRRDGERPGDADRSGELRKKAGWAWLRPFRRLDEYELAIERVEAERRALEAERERETELV
jgi:hypothetical protein